MKRANPLRMLYLERGFTGRKFAAAVGADHNSLLDWESGKVVPHLWYFHRMVEILGDVTQVYNALRDIGIKPRGTTGGRKR